MSSYSYERPKWTTPVITWSFAAAAGVFSNAIGPDYQALVQQAVARWDGVAGISLVQAPDSADAGIRIGFSAFGPNSSEIGETNYTYYNGPAPAFAPGITVAAEDPAERGLGSTLLYAGTQTSLYQVILHELGHALGLGHSTDPASVMYPVATPANRDLNAGDLEAIQGLYGAQGFVMTDITTGASSTPAGDPYPADGPVGYLQRQFIYPGSNGVVIAAQASNVFVHTGDGDDAITVVSGQNVLDAGQGSNFLTGGSGNDTFFVDGRGGQVTWGTLVNFHPGDTATLWGYTAGTSTFTWADDEGAAGYTGRTLHADLAGGGTASITFAGQTTADTTRFALTTGSVGGNDYLAITNLG